MAIDGSATTIEVTPEAATKLIELRADDPKRAFLRLYVSGRSCCSYMYGLAFDENADETDAIMNAAGIKVAIDAQSLPYCDGAKVEWVDGRRAPDSWCATRRSAAAAPAAANPR